MRALREFGAPTDQVPESDFAAPGVVYETGVPPGRIDILTQLTGIAFGEAWPERLNRPFGDVEAPFIGRAAFLENKRATGRPKDFGDARVRNRGGVVRRAIHPGAPGVRPDVL